MLIDDQRLNLQLLRLKDGDWLAPGHAVYVRGGSGSQINVTIRRNRGGPDCARRRGCQQFEGGGKQQESVAGDRNAVSRPLGEIVVLVLFPGAGALSRNRESGQYN